jgi:hypothetical protein
MVKQFHDTPPKPYTTNYSEQDVRDFYKHMHTKKDGCYSYSSVVWSEMCNQHPNLVVKLQVERSSKLFNEKYPPVKPVGIREIKDRLDNKFPWYEVGLGFAIGSLFWGVMFGLFGG